MFAVMFHTDWTFTLLALAIAPVLFGRTCIINAHRLATVRRAGVIFGSTGARAARG